MNRRGRRRRGGQVRSFAPGIVRRGRKRHVGLVRDGACNNPRRSPRAGTTLFRSSIFLYVTHRSQEYTPQTHLVARPVANQLPRLSRPQRNIPGAKERTCPSRLRRPQRFILGTTELHHQLRNTHPSYYPIMPNNAEEKYKKAAVWFSSNKDMRLEAVMRAAVFIDT